MAEPIIAEIKIIPLGTTTTSLSRYITDCIKAVKQVQGMNYQITAMGTIIEAPLEQVLALAQKIHEIPFTMGVKRVLTMINIDDRRDKLATIASKVKAVT